MQTSGQRNTKLDSLKPEAPQPRKHVYIVTCVLHIHTRMHCFVKRIWDAQTCVHVCYERYTVCTILGYHTMYMRKNN